MLQAFSIWLGGSGYLPHGYCFTWSPGLLWTMVLADGLIATAYYSIPLALLRFAQQRKDSSFNGLVRLFSAFIFACGTTHLLAIWTIWVPSYGLEAVAKLLTAGVSVVTAVMLWPLIPKALKIPSVRQLQQAVCSLEAEVAQRRRAEEELARTQERLAFTLSSIGAGIIATDREGRVLHMNPLAEQVTGWPLAEARGQSMWDVWRRDGRPPEIMSVNVVRYLEQQGISEDTLHRVTALSCDGRRTPVEVRATLTRRADGQAAGVTIVFRDMTRLDRADIESRQLAAIVESSIDAIIGKTLDGRITHWNRAAQGLFGYSADDIIGQPVTRLIPPDRHAEETMLLRALAQGRKVPTFNTVRVHKDGRLLDVAVTISPIQDHTGRIVGASKIARDISEQLRNQELRLEAARLEAENQQIQETNRIKTEFLANMSHELRTPLNAIIGFADLLFLGQVPPQSPKHREFLGHIRTSGRHLLQLINDVLDLSKVEAGKFEFFPERVNLPRLAQDAIDILRTEASRKGVFIETVIAPELDDLFIDAARFKQVLYNYLSNAIKFTPDGGRVTVRARAEGDACFRLEVEDTGIGIAEQDLPRLFKQFQQLDGGYTKRYEGTGLGLALTRRLVEAQGGSVGVRSVLGRGTTFHAVLPRQSMFIGEATAVSGPAQLAPQSAAPKGPRVLVIEDDLADQARLSRTLISAGFEVDTASNGELAIQRVASQQYAAITLDLVLPDRTGLDVLASIRAQGRCRNVPVVVVTMVAERSALAGFPVADVLFKPVRDDEVIAAFSKMGLLGTLQPNGCKVLVVDDDPASLALMTAVLQGAGLETVCLQDSRKALSDIDRIRPDAIVLDLMMPELDGFQVLDELQRMPQWRRTPVFIWTSMVLTGAEYARLSASATAILNKGGGEIEALLAALKTWTPRLVMAA